MNGRRGKRKWLSVAVLCWLASAAIAQTEVKLLANWKKGEKRQLELVQTRERTRGNEVVSRMKLRTQVELEVLDASSKGFLVRWSYPDTKVEEATSPRIPNVEDLLSSLKGYKVEVETDAAGEFAGVRNWQELKAAAATMVDTALNATPTLDANMKNAVRQQMLSLFGTQQQIENAFVREIRLYHLVLGGSFTVGKRVTYRDLLPNPFGGEPFPSTGSFLLKEYDAASGRAVVEWKSTLDPQPTRRILLKTFTDLAKRLGAPSPKDSDLPLFNIEDTAEVVVDTKTGWVKSLNHRRMTSTTQAGQAVRDVRTLAMTDKTP
ncbi:MAG: hypothetical protein NZT92_00960 [Abditibacteriales bacterium]|nr:hypothetical protein [Abditibacteriales bacterium]MDW8364551.1 hypothetical protein [Abditibacteriales bacterium]